MDILLLEKGSQYLNYVLVVLGFLFYLTAPVCTPSVHRNNFLLLQIIVENNHAILQPPLLK